MILTIHRAAHVMWRWHVPLLPWLLKAMLRVVFGLALPPSVKVGANVLPSLQGLDTAVHKSAVIGDGAIVSTGVTIGGRSGLAGAPVIGARAFIGTGAKILGPVRVGTGASIGANAVVLADIPDYAVAVGVPARIVRINKPEDLPKYDEFS